jgi:hypothetical protein
MECTDSQRAVLRDSGITFVGKFYYFCPLIARRKVRESRNYGNMPTRYSPPRCVTVTA